VKIRILIPPFKGKGNIIITQKLINEEGKIFW